METSGHHVVHKMTNVTLYGAFTIARETDVLKVVVFKLSWKARPDNKSITGKVGFSSSTNREEINECYSFDSSNFCPLVTPLFVSVFMLMRSILHHEFHKEYLNRIFATPD